MFCGRWVQAAATIVAMSGCGTGTREAPAAKPAPAPIDVRVHPVTPARWPDTFEATGTVKARTSATIAARVTGTVREVRAQAGDHVQAGQLLVQLEATELETAHRQALAGLAESKSALPETAGAIRSAEAQVELARVTFGRMKELLDKRSVSQQEFDEAAARLRVAEAARDSMTARRQQGEDRVRQAEQGVNSAAAMLGYVTIAAPLAGRVVARRIEPGALAMPGQPLLEIEQEGGWRLEAAVEETRLGRIGRGQTVEVRLDALDEVLSGRVSEIVPAVDAASRSFIAKIDLPARPAMRSGLFGRASFQAGEREAIAVPMAAISREGQMESVFVEEAGVARRRLVRLGAARAGSIEVLSGLAAGDRVIHPIPPGLGDGAPVRAAGGDGAR